MACAKHTNKALIHQSVSKVHVCFTKVVNNLLNSVLEKDCKFTFLFTKITSQIQISIKQIIFNNMHYS